MSGKASLILVLGFSVLFIGMGFFWGNIATRSVDNQIDYYSNTMAYNLAVSGANLALNEIYRNSTWNAGYNNISFKGGVINVEVADIDTLTKTITSRGNFNDYERSVTVKMSKSAYAKFAWYIGNASSKNFITGDTIWGPFHTQSFLNIAGDPVFWGKVTAKKGMSPSDPLKKGFYPRFMGGYQSGVDIPAPNNYKFDVQKANAKNGGLYFGSNTDKDLWLTFKGTTVEVRRGTGDDSSKYSPKTEYQISNLSSKVIFMDGGDVYMSGVLNGSVIVVAEQSSGHGAGNIYFTGDITYTQSPVVWDPLYKIYMPNNSCTDMLGVLASNNVWIATSTASGGYKNNVTDEDIHIDANIFCAGGGFETQDVGKIPPSGTLYLRGGIVADKEELVSLTSSGNLTNGYYKHVIFDERFMMPLPPNFPLTGTYEILSWLED